jgi:hypothetical protein
MHAFDTDEVRCDSAADGVALDDEVVEHTGRGPDDLHADVCTLDKVILDGEAVASRPRDNHAKEGHTFPVTGNDANTLTLDLGHDDLLGIPVNAKISVVPNWTLNTVFPASDQNISFTPTLSTAAYKTQVRVPDTSASGVNVPSATYYFSDNAWRLVGDERVIAATIRCCLTATSLSAT